MTVAIDADSAGTMLKTAGRHLKHQPGIAVGPEPRGVLDHVGVQVTEEVRAITGVRVIDETGETTTGEIELIPENAKDDHLTDITIGVSHEVRSDIEGKSDRDVQRKETEGNRRTEVIDAVQTSADPGQTLRTETTDQTLRKVNRGKRQYFEKIQFTACKLQRCVNT